MSGANPTLRHRGYLYAQKIFTRMRSVSEQHPTIQRMRLANAWREGYLAGAREQSREDLAAVKRIEKVISAAEHILDDPEFDLQALTDLRKGGGY